MAGHPARSAPSASAPSADLMAKELTNDEEAVARVAESILIAHQRRDFRSCLCGWSELGKSHCGHQVQMLREASLLADFIDERFAFVADVQ